MKKLNAAITDSVRAARTKLNRLVRGRREEPEPKGEPRYLPPIILTENHLKHMMGQINFERIRRTVMLFDIRWLKEDNTSYIPEEEDIQREAWGAMVKAVHHGRVLGVAEVRDKGFIATYARIDTGSEVLNLRYVLSEASSLG